MREISIPIYEFDGVPKLSIVRKPDAKTVRIYLRDCGAPLGEFAEITVVFDNQFAALLERAVEAFNKALTSEKEVA